MNTNKSKTERNTNVHFFCGALSQAYARKKNNGIANVSGVTWLNVCAKNAGTNEVIRDVNIENSLCFVSRCEIRYAGITKRLANMFGIILNTNGSGMNKPKNASMLSNIGLLTIVLPP